MSSVASKDQGRARRYPSWLPGFPGVSEWLEEYAVAVPASPGTMAEANVRFAYLKGKVMQLQVWREDGGALFGELQAVAADIMGVVARACTSRFTELLSEDGARSLAALGCGVHSEKNLGDGLVHGQGGRSGDEENEHRCKLNGLSQEDNGTCCKR